MISLNKKLSRINISRENFHGLAKIKKVFSLKSFVVYGTYVHTTKYHYNGMAIRMYNVHTLLQREILWYITHRKQLASCGTMAGHGLFKMYHRQECH